MLQIILQLLDRVQVTRRFPIVENFFYSSEL
jgi:hypothetical protein